MSALVERVADFLQTRGLSGTVGVVAISGGPDSVALAIACRTLLDRGLLVGLRFAHVNHLLRGDGSDADERFVRDLAAHWNLPIDVERIDVAALAESQGIGVEEASRHARYDWLAKIAGSARWVATGHNADDRAETVLHHILRGTGLAGLAGIAMRRLLADGVELIRPLLAVSRTQILEFLQTEDVGYRIDDSNADVAFTRNRLRHELMPQLVRDWNPALVAVLNRLARQAGDWQHAISERTAELLIEVERPRAGAVIVLAREPLAKLNVMWIREIARAIWHREGWPLGEMTFDDWDRSASVVRGERSAHDFPGGVRIDATRHVVQLRKR